MQTFAKEHETRAVGLVVTDVGATVPTTGFTSTKP